MAKFNKVVPRIITSFFGLTAVTALITTASNANIAKQSSVPD